MKQDPVQIAQLIDQKRLLGSNPGLMHGNMGLCIFFYHLARISKNPDFDKIAGDLLDKAFDNMSELVNSDFEKGIAGIGWGIEFLVQNKFIEAETDEILEEADNKVFKILTEFPFRTFELDNGLMGYLLYLIYRLKNKPLPLSNAAQINRELIILTINKIDEMVTEQFPTIVKELQFDLFWRFPVMLLGLTEAHKLHIYNDKIVCMFEQWIPYFEAYIPSLHINRLFMALAFKQIHSLMPDKRLEKQVQILQFATDFEVIKTEVDHKDLSIRNGWPGIVLLLHLASKEFKSDLTYYQKIEQTYNAIIEKQHTLFENLQLNNSETDSQVYGLALGLSGIGLTELFWPGILSGDSVK